MFTPFQYAMGRGFAKYLEQINIAAFNTHDCRPLHTVHSNNSELLKYALMLKEYELLEDYIWTIIYIFKEALVEKNSVVSNDISKVLGRKAKDFGEYARETAIVYILALSWNQKMTNSCLTCALDASTGIDDKTCRGASKIMLYRPRHHGL